MNSKSKLWILGSCLLLLWSIWGTSAVHAQNDQGQPVWKSFAPEVRKEKRREYFQSLPRDQQQRLRQHQMRFKSFSPQQKRNLCQRFHSENGYLPPACLRLTN